MKKIKVKKILFDAIAYYPRGSDYSWDEIKAEIKSQTGKDVKAQTIHDTANFLINNLSFGKNNKKVKRIHEFYNKFKFEEIYRANKYNQIEACTSEDGKSIFIRGGNTRLIAYTIRIIKDGEKITPIDIGDWVDSFKREDRANIEGKDTITNAKIT